VRLPEICSSRPSRSIRHPHSMKRAPLPQVGAPPNVAAHAALQEPEAEGQRSPRQGETTQRRLEAPDAPKNFLGEGWASGSVSGTVGALPRAVCNVKLASRFLLHRYAIVAFHRTPAWGCTPSQPPSCLRSPILIREVCVPSPKEQLKWYRAHSPAAAATTLGRCVPNARRLGRKLSRARGQ
jgi:hypothetical protein